MKGIGFILGILFILLVIFLPGFSKMQELRQDNKELEEKIARTKEENRALGEEKTKLSTDGLYLENVARQKMGITKKGETVYRLSPDEE